MRVAITTEGTYPYSRGGVGTWVDQVVHGLPEHEFDIYAITGGVGGSPVYDLPGNVRRVTPFDPWGQLPRKLRLTRTVEQSFAEAWEVVVAAGFGRSGSTTAELRAAWGVLASWSVAARLPQLVSGPLGISILMRAHAESLTGSDAAESRWSLGKREPVRLEAYVHAAHFISRMLLPLSQDPLEADVVHATANGPSILPALTANASGIPVVMSEHGVYLRERLLALGETSWSTAQRSVVAAVVRSLVQVGYTVADLVAPCTSYNKRWERRLGVPEEKLNTLNNGVDISRFRPSQERPERPTLSFVGRMDPLKDLLTLMRSFKLVLAEEPNVLLRVFGPVPECNTGYFEQVQDECQRLGIANSVVFEGAVSDPAPAYHAGSIVVLSSVSEAFPYSVLEAMACGRALVVTDVGGVREALGDAGHVVPARDPQSFAAACLDLLRDPAEADAMGRLGRARLEEFYTLDLMLDNLRNIYRSVDALRNPWNHRLETVPVLLPGQAGRPVGSRESYQLLRRAS